MSKPPVRGMLDIQVEGVTPEQVRGARAMLGWSRTKLAERSGLSRASVSSFESDRRLLKAKNVGLIVGALRAAGVVFLRNSRSDDESAGVLLRY